MRKHFWISMMLLVILAGMTTITGASPAQQELDTIPPSIVETIPFQGEELLLDQPITFYFDQPMDRASVEAALTLAPDASLLGTITWQDDLTMTVAPADEWLRDAELTFTLAKTAAGSDGVRMADPYEISFQTVGYLEVAEVLPADGQREIDANSLITVIFNRPVVPLVSIEEQTELPSPVTISPAVEGTGEWLNTSIFVFRPERGLAGGITYTATVTAGLADVTGAILQEDYSWQFSTLQPEITEVYPSPDSTGIVLEPSIRMTFSQPMNPDTTAQAFLVEEMGASAPVGKVNGSITWENENRWLIFTPAERLELDTEYRISIDTAIATSESGAFLEAGWTSSFFTVPYPAIVGTYPSDGEDYARPYGGFEVYFNAPIDPKTLEDKFIIEPTPWREFSSYYYDYGYDYSLYFDTEPSTDYTVTILPGIADPYGNTINETMVVRYTTAPYDPEINLNVPAFAGLYSAHNPTTRVFATHRNVERLNLQLYEIDLFTLAQFEGDNFWQFRDQFVPDPSSLVRSWSLNVQSQLNQRRYELLLMSKEGDDGIENLQCLGAPETRMQTGDIGMVSLDDPRPLRVRADPNLQGQIITELNPGAQFEVIGGPICADGFIWWNIQVFSEALDEQIVGWSAEGTTENYFIEMLQRSGPILTEVNPEDFPGLDPGAYYLTMRSPQTDALGYSPIRHVLLVANVNLTLKYTPNRMMVWATDLNTGEPVANIPVEFFDKDFAKLGQLNTDENGIAILEIPRLTSLYTSMFASVDDDEHFGFTAGNWDSGLSPWQFDMPGDYEPQTLAVYLYSDRPLYRPGQPVYFRGVVRDRDDVTLTLPAGLDSVPVQVFDPEGQAVFDKRLELTPYGTFSGDFTLDNEAALGYYSLSIELPGDPYNYYYNLGFLVGEYVAPEFQTTLTPSADAVVQGDTVDVMVESRYFFGGSVSNADVSWSVLSANYFFNYQGEGYYSFVDFNYDEGPGEYYDTYGEEIAQGEGKTDADGRFLISIPADLGKKTQSQEYTIEARVVDESDQLVAGRATVIVHQGEVYVGLRPEEYIGTAGEESGILVVSVDWDSEPVSGQEIEYQIVNRVWSSVQEEDPTGRTVWTWEVEEIPLEDGTGTVTTDAEGAARIAFVPPHAGTYKIYASTHDSRGNEVRSSAFMWVSGEEYVSWRQQNSNRFDLITNADSYKVGDTAEILIASPFQGEVTALVTLERGDILRHEVIILKSNSEVYRLPITPDFAPNVFVSVLIVKGVDENNAYAEFRMGMAQLAVDTEQLVMNVEITPDVDIAAGEFKGPGDEVTYKIKTTDWQGNPVQAEVGIGVTDLAVLSIASPNSGTLLDYFYSQRGVSVRTSTPLTISVDKVTQTIIDTIKGGGGGGDDAGIFEIREEFVDTPGWEPALVTDENGEANYTLTLPDNLTTWRLDARAVTDGVEGPMLVGQTTVDVLSTKPLLLRPLTPRFLIVDDVVELGAIVNNNTGDVQTVEISLEGTGFMLEDESANLSQTVEIPAGGRQRVNWRVRVLDVSAVDVTFFANGNNGAFTDASKPTATQGKPLPVYKYEVPEIVGTGGVLTEAGSQSELVSLPRSFDVTQGTLTLQVDRSLAAAMTDALSYLENFPYQCTEQTVSLFLPNVVTSGALKQLGLYDLELQENLDREVNFAIQRLYANQKVDGGWGWFPEYESSTLVTAYALIGLSEAREAGYPIDQAVLNRAAEFLQIRIDDFSPRDEQYLVNRQAFLIYAMVRAGYFQASQASVLYDLRTRMSTDAKAFLALSMAAMNPQDSRVPVFMSDFLSTAVLSATGAHWEDEPEPWNWTTDTRSTALVLQAMVELDPQNTLIPQVVRWLMVARDGDAWETTQETAWAVMALTDWMVASGELRPDYTFKVGLNGQEQVLADDTATPDNVKESEILRFEVAQLIKDQGNRVTFSRTDGQGNLYYRAHLKAYLPVPEVDAVSRGIIIDRKYYPARSEEENPKAITGGTVGEEVEVVLTIVVPNDLYFVVIEDPIPAGSAAVDPKLLTSSVISEGPSLDRPLSYGWGWWWFGRTEFRDEKVVMYSDYLPRGTYEYRYTLRLGLPGTFNVIPPSGYEFYFPEVYGRGEGSLFTIAAASE
jgi:hypothetical protein